MTTIEVGTELPQLQIPLTRETVVRYAGASTDFNPIHWSDRHAQALGLDGVVAHGMWTMGAAVRAVTEWLDDPSHLISYFVRFISPVKVPDTDAGTTLVVSGNVSAIKDDIATIALTVTCEGEKVLGAAKAEVRLV